MSRTAIRCPTCKQPLAEKHRAGRIDVLVDAIRAEHLHEEGVVLVCKACGAERYIQLVPPERATAA